MDCLIQVTSWRILRIIIIKVKGTQDMGKLLRVMIIFTFVVVVMVS